MDVEAQDVVQCIKNRRLAEVWIRSDKGNRESAIYNEISSLLTIEEPSEKLKQEIINWSRLFCLAINKKWKDVSRSRQRFQTRYDAWLQHDVCLSDSLLNIIQNEKSAKANNLPTQPTCGRPKKPFEECSTKTKKRRVVDLTSGRSSDELQFAADLVRPSTSKKEISSLPLHQALALYLDLDLSERKYNVLRSVVNVVHPKCFPSLYKINQTKNSLIPPSVTSTEISADVELQELIKYTIESLVNISDLEGSSNKLKLTCKWGFDGSSGHSRYKQRFSEAECTDEYLFLVAMVPLRLTDTETGRDVWINLKPSSTLFCRPIKLIFKKETADLLRSVEKDMNDKIKNLRPCNLTSNCNHDYQVSCEMIFTMMDCSVVNTLSDTNATSNCVICGATPKQMNTKQVLERTPSEGNYRFGLSTLHCWIRFMECILHIGYRLPIKVWQDKGDVNKEVVGKNKQRIQMEFRSKMGLLIDKPKPGFGSTNDGNTARRFFCNADWSSEITGVDKILITNFSIILKVLASGNQIDTVKFRALLEETRQLYISLYSWYYMPSSVHKVLVHGCDIIDAFSLPIGQLSEDALEARHKEVRKHRLSHTRKFSRESSNKDLMRILLLTSDPFISSKRNITTKKIDDLSEDVKQYLLQTQEPFLVNDLDLDLASICSSSTEDSSSDSE